MQLRSIVSATSIVILAALTGAGCLHSPSLMVQRPRSVELDSAVTKRWADEVRRHARHGDWLLTRSYTVISDVIVSVTPGDDFGHGSIYDAERDMIIESIDSGVREVPLEKLVRRTDDIMVVRANVSAVDRAKAVERARAMIGTGYDHLGLVGLQDPTKFYCSELVYWSINPYAHGWSEHLVVTPADLLRYARTIWYSGTRGDSVRILRGEMRARAAVVRE